MACAREPGTGPETFGSLGSFGKRGDGDLTVASERLQTAAVEIIDLGGRSFGAQTRIVI